MSWLRINAAGVGLSEGTEVIAAWEDDNYYKGVIIGITPAGGIG